MHPIGADERFADHFSDLEQLERTRRPYLERGATAERTTLADEPDAGVDWNAGTPRHVERHIGRDVDAALEIGLSMSSRARPPMRLGSDSGRAR